MSVYIKGMGMPQNCEECPFCDYEQGECFANRGSLARRSTAGIYATICSGPGAGADARPEKAASEGRSFMKAIRITLPGVPPSLNQFAGRENTNEYRSAKADWTDRVVWMVKKVRPDKPYEKAKVEILYYFPDNRRRDPDNYCGKLLLDGLTKAGVIVDDSFQHITLAVGGAVDMKQPRTVITVEEVIDE